jgi:maltose O-acetyltransferase
VIRGVCWLLYYGFAQFLPLSYRPLGRLWKALRGVLVRGMATSAGRRINIESRVEIGSGRLLRIGSDSGIGPRSQIGEITIGNGVIIGPELIALTTNHRFEDPEVWIGSQGYSESQPIEIGDGAWIGARVILLPGVRIGRFAVVGAGSVVAADVPDYAVAVGNPAKVTRDWREAKTGPE